MTPEQEQQIVPYLLDVGPEPDRLEVEERLLADKELLSSVRAIEDELVRDYCKGELDPGLRVLFERRLSWDTGLQQKLAFMNVLLPAVGAMRDALGTPSRRSILELFATFVHVRLLNVAAGGLALALVAGITWIGIENAHLRKELAAVGRIRSALVQENRALRSRGIGPAEHVTEAAPMQLALAFPLVPGLTQGQSEPQRIEIPSGAADVTLQLVLTRPAETNRFRIILKNADGDVILRSTTAASAGRRYLPIRVERARLAEGDYALGLQVGVASGEYQDWESYFFGVIRK